MIEDMRDVWYHTNHCILWRNGISSGVGFVRLSTLFKTRLDNIRASPPFILDFDDGLLLLYLLWRIGVHTAFAEFLTSNALCLGPLRSIALQPSWIRNPGPHSFGGICLTNYEPTTYHDRVREYHDYHS